MSFGNRSSSSKRSQGRRSPGGFDPSQIKMKQQGLDWGGIVTAFAWVVIAISVGTIGYLQFGGSSKEAAVKPNRQALAIFSSEPIPRARHYTRKGTLKAYFVDETDMSFSVNSTDTGLDAIDSELHEKCTKKISSTAANWSVETGKGYLNARMGARFVTCIMKHQRSRLCEPDYRKRLAGRVQKYLNSYKRTVAKLKSWGKNPIARNTIALAKQIDSAGSNGNVSSGFKMGPIVPAAMGDQLRLLSGLGLLAPSDFGGVLASPPKEVLPYLKEDVPSPC